VAAKPVEVILKVFPKEVANRLSATEQSTAAELREKAIKIIADRRTA